METGAYVFRSGKYIGYPVKDFINLTANLNPAWSVKRESTKPPVKWWLRTLSRFSTTLASFGTSFLMSETSTWRLIETGFPTMPTTLIRR